MTVLALARTAMAYQVQTVASVSPFLLNDLNIDYTALGTLIGIYMLPGVVLALPGGLLGKHFDDTRMCHLGLALMAAGGALMGLTESYAVVTFGRLVSGVGAVILNVVLTKMVADWFAGREIITAMALFVNSWPLGLALGLVTQGSLAEIAGWALVMHLAAALCLASLILIAISYHPPPGRASRKTAGGSWMAAFRLGLNRRELALTLLAGAVWSFYNVAFIVVVSFAPDFLIARGHSLADAGSIASIATWLALISIPLGGYLAERSGRANSVLAGSLAAYAGVIAALTLWEAPVLWFALMGLVNGVPAGIIMALPARAVRAAALAPAMGLYFTSYYLSMTVLPAVAGWTRDAAGSADAPLLFAAAMIMVAILAFAAFRWTESRAQALIHSP